MKYLENNKLWNLGLIEQDELVEIMTSLQTNQEIDQNYTENVCKIFQTLDTNGDWRISEDEFTQTFLNYVKF